ncbi:MAG: ribosome-associated translation inhibitor RaiA [Clostridia bacterium]|nr:ribosome-associated translation inhibitor RaiA [Clostridia bacterium]
MKITVVGRQMSVRESLKQLVEKKLSKFDRFFDDEAEAIVKFGHVRDLERLEITISAGGTLFRCEEEESSYENALDECIESIERQIRKNKTRLAKRLREGAFVPAPAEPEAPAEEEEENTVIRTKVFRMKPMTPDEAILQMNLLGHDFFMFRDSVSEEACVVYRRRDGAYGLIVPEK